MTYIAACDLAAKLADRHDEPYYLSCWQMDWIVSRYRSRDAATEIYAVLPRERAGRIMDNLP